MKKKLTKKENQKGYKTFIITMYSRLFNLTNQISTDGNKTRASSNVILYGHVQSTSIQKQIVVARGYKDTDLAIKIGGTSGIELEVLLPPSDFDIFVELLSHKPKACSFDTTVTPPEFQIVVEY
jgi:hypothetical protein